VITIAMAVAAMAQAAPADFRQETVRAALMATHYDDAVGFASFVSKGAKVIDLDGKSALLKSTSLRPFTAECSLVDWGNEMDGKWELFWQCPDRNVIMSFAFKRKAISQVELLLAPPTLRRSDAEPPVVHFPETVNRQ